MILEPLPGVTLERLQKEFREHVEHGFTNLRGAGHNRLDLYNAFIEWANMASKRLVRLVTAESLERFPLSRRYWLLQSMADTAETMSVYHLLEAELDELARNVDTIRQEIHDAIARWSRPGRFVIPDTSFYIEHKPKLEEVDFRPLLNIREERVHVLMPILVVDQLDGLKRSKDTNARWRAGYTLAVIDDRLRDPSWWAILQREDFSPLQHGGIPSGEVTIEIVFDPPGHARLPIDDDELVDRGLACQALAGRPVTMLTYDNRQSTRARMVGLDVNKLPFPVGPEPPG